MFGKNNICHCNMLNILPLNTLRYITTRLKAVVKVEYTAQPALHRTFGFNHRDLLESWQVALVDDILIDCIRSHLFCQNQLSGCEVSSGRCQSSALGACGLEAQYHKRKLGVLDMHPTPLSQPRRMARLRATSLDRRKRSAQ